ncbi:MAG TPA: choice-of-anchor tandem repeat GloVer-containing protein [Verrucomicrobiae bacterium]|jgi:uncharacterized repeat protein (TIGR03803 family)
MKRHIQNVHVALAAIFFSLLAISSATAQSFANLHTFAGFDGANPQAGVIFTNNVLYGTTRNGGSGLPGEDGTVFRLNSNGSGFTNLYSFTGGTDGGQIYSSLVLWGTTLFGTSIFGGASNSGCIFSIQTNGTQLYNIHSFGDDFFDTNIDGTYPNGGLQMVGNTLYGTCGGGGTEDWGNVFSCNTNGLLFEFTNLLNFNLTNGQYPAGVIVSGSTIYGISSDGGTNSSGDYSGYGCIFSMKTDGSLYSNLYDFTSAIYTNPTNSDGAFPGCAPTLVGNTLYGTTTYGGNFANGTIFKINTDGSAFTVLHYFSATNGIADTNIDGDKPESTLLYWDNALFGTTSRGGKFGNGTLFKINLDGSGFTTLHTFSSTNNASMTNSDGADPLGNLIVASNTLYGTTSMGGTNADGTIYAVTFPLQLGITLSGTNVVLFWPATDPGFNLQYATSLTPPVTWNTIPATQTIVTNTASPPGLYYRLMHP